MKVKILTLSLLLHSALAAWTQNVQEIQKKYPGDEAVVWNNTLFYKIKIKDGEPQVESKNIQQILYLSGNTSAYMSKYGFSHSSFHKVTDYEAYTKTPDNKKIKVTNFKTTASKSQSVFYDDVEETSFDFPGLSSGAVGTLETTVQHKDAHMLSPFYVTRRIPVVHGELKISFPKDMSVKYIIKGTAKDKVTFSQETKKGETIFTFTGHDLPADKSYPDAPDNAYYSTHIIFYIESYKNEKGEPVTYLSNLDDLYKMNYTFVRNINKEMGAELKHVVDSLTEGAASMEQKSRKIYSWVQQNIKYVAFEAGMEGFIPRDANLVCSRRFGDCKDMSSILTTMLNYAGVPAYYTWIGTRDIPYDYTEVPTPIVDNHMICTIKLKDQYIFLDGTDPSCVFGIPSEGIQGKQAFLSINDKEYKIVRVPTPEKERNVLVDSTFLELTDRGIKGSIAIHMTGYYAMDMNSTLTYVNGKDREQYFKGRFNRGSNKFKLEKFELPHQGDNNVRLTGEFDLQDYAKKVAGEWYINLNLFKLYEHEEIDYPKRTIPVEFPYRFVKKYVTILKIPEGFAVSYLPQSKSYKNETWGFDMTYEQKNDVVILTQEFHNDQMLLYPEKFAEWNKVLEHLFPLYKESISLSKTLNP